MMNALTFDLEDYFMVSAFEKNVSKASWDQRPFRLRETTSRILDLLDRFETKATFFSVGWIADRHPDLIQKIAGRGHEIACHGYHHQLIYDLSPDQFREDLRRAKSSLESAAAVPVIGYRAPSFSVVEKTLWALEILEEEGFLYDASVLPAAHARGGLAGARRFPYRHRGLAEFPMSTVLVGGRTFPFSGGGYFRLFPYAVTRWGIRQCLAANQPAVVYLHPWEFDPAQPRVEAPLMDRFKHYVNLSQTEGKLQRLLADFSFGRASDVLVRLGLLGGVSTPTLVA